MNKKKQKQIKQNNMGSHSLFPDFSFALALTGFGESKINLYLAVWFGLKKKKK